MDSERRRRCIEAFQASMSSELGQEIDRYLTELPDNDGEPWNFSSILEQVKQDPTISPETWITSLRRRANNACRMFGRETPVSLCILTLVKEIEDAVAMITNDKQVSLHPLFRKLKEISNTVLSDLPDTMSEFQEYMGRERRVVQYKRQDIGRLDESIVSVDEVEQLCRRCKSVDDDEVLAGVVDIIQRFEPTLDSSNDDDSLEVDMARFSGITVAKINKYLDSRRIPEVPAVPKGRVRMKARYDESRHEARDGETGYLA